MKKRRESNASESAASIDLARVLLKSTQEHRDQLEAKLQSRRQLWSAKDKSLLESYFQEDGPTWSKEKLNSLSLQLKRSRAQIYKWNWDRKKKEQFEEMALPAFVDHQKWEKATVTSPDHCPSSKAHTRGRKSRLPTLNACKRMQHNNSKLWLS